VYYNYYRGKPAKELADMFKLKQRTVYNIINRAEKETVLEVCSWWEKEGHRPYRKEYNEKRV